MFWDLTFFYYRFPFNDYFEKLQIVGLAIIAFLDIIAKFRSID